MKASVRLVHFCPDPFSGTRFPLGAVIEGRQVHVTKSPVVPDAHCLGGQQQAALARMLHARLDTLELKNSCEIVNLLGPFVTLSAPRDVPEQLRDVPEISNWVIQVFLGGAQPSPNESSNTRTHAPRLRTYGRQFFTTYGVARYVHANFRPERFFEQVGPLHPITHWAGGTDSELLLMEPLLPERESFRADVEGINTKFSSYRFALSEAKSLNDAAIRNPRGSENYYAFLLRGGSRKDRDYAKASLRQSAHEIFDLENDAARREFLDRIEAVGRKTIRQGSFSGFDA